MCGSAECCVADRFMQENCSGAVLPDQWRGAGIGARDQRQAELFLDERELRIEQIVIHHQ